MRAGWTDEPSTQRALEPDASLRGIVPAPAMSAKWMGPLARGETTGPASTGSRLRAACEVLHTMRSRGVLATGLLSEAGVRFNASCWSCSCSRCTSARANRR
jgi:hypothetical protein